MAKLKFQNPYKDLPDAELIARYKEEGDQNFLASLYSRYSGLILGASFKYLKNKEEARDASADIYEELISKVLNTEIQFFRSWIYRLVVNHCLMKLRKNKHLSGEEIKEEKIEDLFVESSPFEHLIASERGEDLLKEGLGGLEEKQRICVEKFYLNEKSYKEIVAETGWEYNQVKSFIQNGLRNLRIIINKKVKIN